jgi:uncharacterized protein (DUF111 family)
VHFHELGMMDAVLDILGVCMLLEMLSPDKIVVSPIIWERDSRYRARRLPVPAPATAELLKGFPVYSGDIRGELTTPTERLCCNISPTFWSNACNDVKQIGYGMGTKDFERCNCLRAFFGTVEAAPSLSGGPNGPMIRCRTELQHRRHDLRSALLYRRSARENGALTYFFFR